MTRELRATAPPGRAVPSPLRASAGTKFKLAIARMLGTS